MLSIGHGLLAVGSKGAEPPYLHLLRLLCVLYSTLQKATTRIHQPVRSWNARKTITWQVRFHHAPNHRWRLTRKAFLGGLRPPRPS